VPYRYFSDANVGGQTYGYVYRTSKATSGGGITWEIWDRLPNPSRGLYARAYGGLTSDWVQFATCYYFDGSRWRYFYPHVYSGRWIEIRCASGEIEAIEGEALMTFGSMTAVIPEGGILEVDDVGGTYDLTVPAESAASVDIGGLVLAPGQSVTGVEDTDMDGAPDSVDPCPDDYTGSPGGPPCDDDDDDDGVLDVPDNCVAWSNPSQALPPWTVPAGDHDCDGFDSDLESSIGTLPLAACPATSAAYDEDIDAWAPDLDDNQTVDVLDVLSFKPTFNSSLESGSYEARWDLNADGSTNILDVLALKPTFGKTC
jgi:hypothetical protein